MKVSSIAAGLAAVAATCLLAVTPTAGADLPRTAQWGGGLPERHFVPEAIEADSQDRLYVVDAAANRILRIEADGSAGASWKIRGGTSFPATYPFAMTIDGDDRLYVLDRSLNRVVKFDTDGNELGSWTVEDPAKTQDIAFAAGSVFVIGQGLVRRYSPTGDPLGSWGGFETEGALEWVRPLIESDGAGNLLVTASTRTGYTATKSIYRFEPDGNLVSKWTSPAVVDQTPIRGVMVASDVEGYTGIKPAGGDEFFATDPQWSDVVHRISATALTPPLTGPPGTRPLRSFTITATGDTAWTTGEYVNRTAFDGSDYVWWGQDAFPVLSGDRFLGDFREAGDLTVRNDGVVGAFDPEYARAQLFTPVGGFRDVIDGPVPHTDAGDHVAFMLPETGGVEFFRLKTGQLLRYSEQGDLLQTVEFERDHEFREVALRPEGGYVTSSLHSESQALIEFFDRDGRFQSEFLTSRYPNMQDLWWPSLEAGPGGVVYMATSGQLQKYSSTGQVLASWSPAKPECAPEYGLDDIAVGPDGKVYAIAGRDPGGPAVLKFDSDLDQLWEEPTEFSQPIGRRSIDVGPSGSIYVAVGDGIERYEQSTYGAQPPKRVCPPPKPTLRFAGVKFGPGHRWARISLAVSGKGWLTLTGNKLRSRKRQVPGRGVYDFKVRLAAKYGRPGPRARKVTSRIRVVFQSNGHYVGKLRMITLKVKKKARRSR